MGRPKVLLTGGSGFIGRNILESFLKDRFDFTAPTHAELDLVDSTQVDAYFARRRFDAVVHAAVKPGHRNAKDPTALFYSNTRMFFNLRRHAGKVARLLVLGSGGGYEPCGPRVKEESFGARVPAGDHGFGKYVCWQAMRGSENIYDLRGFGIFGRYEDYAIRFISNLMCKCVFDLPLTMKQDRRFDYLYVDDLMPVLERFLTGGPFKHRDYNVTPDETVSLLDLAGRIRALSGKDLPIVVKTPGLGPEYSGDNARLKAEFPGFRPRPFDQSLPELYRWYLDHRDAIRREELLIDK